jgi:putative SOS response-associated peptidase YedK
MCGRFTLTAPGELVAEALGLDETPELAPRFNAAPGTAVSTLRFRPAGRRLEPATWGVPHPAAGEEPAAQGLLINARSETAAGRPAFREAFAASRCLIPADGFYEWRRAGARREAFHIRRPDRSVFCFAGLILRVAAPDGAPEREGCVILTTEPNALVAGIHDRMPVILPPDAYGAWLDPLLRDPRRLEEWLRPAPAAALEAVAVGPWVNDARHDGPECLESPRQRRLFE